MGVVTWRSVHVAFHDRERTDDLLLDAIRPLAEAVHRAGLPVHVARHWRRGPHVRVDVQGTSADVAGVVLPLVRATVEPSLRTAPSVVELDPAALLPEHRRLAETEQDDGPLMPWYPDNTVVLTEADDRSAVLGAVTADVLVQGSVAATPALFAALEHRRCAGTSRLALSFDLLVLTAHHFAPHGLPGAALSLRSHAEAHLSTSTGPDVRAAWDATSARSVTALAERVRALTAEDVELPHHLALWLVALRRWQPTVAAAAEDGSLARSAEAVRPRDVGPHATTAPIADLSPFHRTLQEQADAWDELRASPWFITYRLLLNHTYLQLTRLGVAPEERFRVCHLAADAVAHLTGEDNTRPDVADVVRRTQWSPA